MFSPLLTAPSSIHPATTYAVHLTYFRSTGWYYSSSAQYRTSRDALFKVFKEVKDMVEAGQLTGLKQCAQYITLIDVPDHPHNYPHLIMTEEAS